MIRAKDFDVEKVLRSEKEPEEDRRPEVLSDDLSDERTDVSAT